MDMNMQQLDGDWHLVVVYMVCEVEASTIPMFIPPTILT